MDSLEKYFLKAIGFQEILERRKVQAQRSYDQSKTIATSLRYQCPHTVIDYFLQKERLNNERVKMVGKNASHIDTCKKHLDETDKELDQIDNDVMATNAEQKCTRLQYLVDKTWAWEHRDFFSNNGLYSVY